VETFWKKRRVPPHLQKNFNSYSSANHIAKEEVNHAENSPSCVDHKATTPAITQE